MSRPCPNNKPIRTKSYDGCYSWNLSNAHRAYENTVHVKLPVIMKLIFISGLDNQHKNLKGKKLKEVVSFIRSQTSKPRLSHKYNIIFNYVYCM